MNQQTTQKVQIKNQEYEQVQQIDEDEQFFLKRRQMISNARNKIKWKGTFVQQIQFSNNSNKEPLQMTFLDKNDQINNFHQKQEDESQFSQFNQSSSHQSQKQQQKLNDSSNKTTCTYSLTPTENSQAPEKIVQPSSCNLSLFGLQQNNKEILYENERKNLQNGQKYINNNCNIKQGVQGLDKSIYLKPGKSIYEVKVENLGQHIFFKYKKKNLQVCPNNSNFIFQEFLNRNILLPKFQLESIPTQYWKGCCELLVIFINHNYNVVFKQIIDKFNKNKIYNKYTTEDNGFFNLSLLRNKYSKAQMLINTVEQKIACLKIMKDLFTLQIEEQQRKIQNLWIMRSFEKAQEFCNQKIKIVTNKKIFKDLKNQLIKDRDWWISNYFNTIDI